MTLIITALSDLGIVMVGDTSITEDCLNANRTIGERAFSGLIKVVQVPKLAAGLAYWGWTKMPPDQQSQNAEHQNGVWLDWWLQNLVIERQADYQSLEDLAHILENELRVLVPPLNKQELKISLLGNGGIHLAGFEEVDGTRQPCFWHIHNGISRSDLKIDPCIVNANCDYPPLKIPQGNIYMTRNGDFETYAEFFDGYFKDFVRDLNVKQEMVLPFPSLVSHAEFWSAQIRFISALYEASGRFEKGELKRTVKGIGDEITTLTIDAEGIRSYFTR